MTREEEIEKALNFYAPSFWDDTKSVMSDEEISISFEGFRRGARWADEHPNKWISVKDYLPKQDEEVIVLVDEPAPFYKIAFGHIVDKERCKDYNGWNIPNVVYWIPMPSLPQFIKTIIG